jgi:hypothetical protein
MFRLKDGQRGAGHGTHPLGILLLTRSTLALGFRVDTLAGVRIFSHLPATEVCARLERMSAAEPLNKPNLTINRVYTPGWWSNAPGRRKMCPKDSLRVEAYGDRRLNAVGRACECSRSVTAHAGLQPMIGILTRVQHGYSIWAPSSRRGRDVHPNNPVLPMQTLLGWKARWTQ